VVLGVGWSIEKAKDEMDLQNAYPCGIRDLLYFWKSRAKKFPANAEIEICALGTVVPVRISDSDRALPGLWHPMIKRSGVSGKWKTTLNLHDPGYESSCHARILAES
jgi:hypothetical protein